MATINAWGSAKPAQEAFGGTNQSTYTTGDILYASNTNTLSKLAVGSTGNVLQVTAGVPAWGSVPGGTSPWVFLQTKTVSGSPSNIAFDNTVMTSTYPFYMFVINSLYPTSSDDIIAQLSSNNGSTYVNSGYHNNYMKLIGGFTPSGASDTTRLMIYNAISSTGGSGIGANFFTLYLANLTTNSGIAYPTFSGCGNYHSTTAFAVYIVTGGSLFTAAVYNNIQFTPATGGNTFSSGTISLYGLKNS